MVKERLTHVRYLGQFSHPAGHPHTVATSLTGCKQERGFQDTCRPSCTCAMGTGTPRVLSQAWASLAFPQGTARESPTGGPSPCRGAGAGPGPAVSSPSSNTHTCLCPGTLAASGGKKGNSLCFKYIFISAGRKKSKFEESMAKTFLFWL